MPFGELLLLGLLAQIIRVMSASLYRFVLWPRPLGTH